MLPRFWMAVTLAVLLSGCLGGNDEATPTGDTEDPEPDAAPEPVLPDSIEAQEQVTGGLSVLGIVSQSRCGGAATACYRYPFEVEEPVSVDVTLTWGLSASDFDIYIYRDETAVARATAKPPGTTEQLATVLDAGAYTLVVTPVIVTRDAFSLVATFAAP